MIAYEGIRQESQLAAIGTVPTALMRQGNFSEVSAQLRNPLTGRTYPGNIIPQSDLSPIALRSCRSTSRRRTGQASPPISVGSRLVNVNQDQILFRVDQNLGNRARVYSGTTGRMSSSTRRDQSGYGHQASRKNSNYLARIPHIPNLLHPLAHITAFLFHQRRRANSDKATRAELTAGAKSAPDRFTYIQPNLFPVSGQ